MKILATVLDTAPLLINANLVPKKQGSPASAPKWSELQPVTRLYCNSLLRILHDVADDELYQVLLEQLDSLVTYIAIFPQARKAYVKVRGAFVISTIIYGHALIYCLNRFFSNFGQRQLYLVPYANSACLISVIWPACQ
jgi:hypothetical protein